MADDREYLSDLRAEVDAAARRLAAAEHDRDRLLAIVDRAEREWSGMRAARDEAMRERDHLRAVIQDVRDEGPPVSSYGCAWCAHDVDDEVGHESNCAWVKIAEEADHA